MTESKAFVNWENVGMWEEKRGKIPSSSAVDIDNLWISPFSGDVIKESWDDATYFWEGTRGYLVECSVYLENGELKFVLGTKEGSKCISGPMEKVLHTVFKNTHKDMDVLVNFVNSTYNYLTSQNNKLPWLKFLETLFWLVPSHSAEDVNTDSFTDMFEDLRVEYDSTFGFYIEVSEYVDRPSTFPRFNETIWRKFLIDLGLDKAFLGINVSTFNNKRGKVSTFNYTEYELYELLRCSYLSSEGPALYMVENENLEEVDEGSRIFKGDEYSFLPVVSDIVIRTCLGLAYSEANLDRLGKILEERKTFEDGRFLIKGVEDGIDLDIEIYVSPEKFESSVASPFEGDPYMVGFARDVNDIGEYLEFAKLTYEDDGYTTVLFKDIRELVELGALNKENPELQLNYHLLNGMTGKVYLNRNKDYYILVE